MPGDRGWPDAGGALRARVLFRADASRSIGGGHVMRCLTLAAELERRGAAVAFASGPGTIEAVPALARAGYPVLASDRALPPCDLLVVDHYGLAADGERRLVDEAGARRVLVVDDLADRAHACDLLLDMTYGRSPGNYDGLVPSGARVLAGSAFALLRPAFAAGRPGALARRGTGPVRRILVSLGLTDVGGVTRRAVEALFAAAPELPDLEAVDVVVGSTAPSLPALRALAAREPRVTLHLDPERLAEMMAGADVAIGAAGTTAWERCCLGLPSVVLVLADNQAGNARALEEAGAALVVDGRDLQRGIAEALAELNGAPEKRRAMTAAAARICDGFGISRVADAVLACEPAGEAAVGFRRATPDDADRLWRWRNDPVTRANSRRPEPIARADHARWLSATLAHPDTWLLVAESEGKALGTVRFDRPGDDGAREVSITLAPEHRGRGLGGRTLAGACRSLRAHGVRDAVRGRIKAANLPSLRAFERAGFGLASPGDGWVAATLPPGVWPSASPSPATRRERLAS